MFSTLISLSAAWIVLIFFHEIDADPSFTEEPSNPSRVDEGDNITLRWTYNIDGTFRDSTFTRAGATIALKDSSGLAVAAEFSDHVQVIILDSEAALTLLHVNRSDDEEYQYFIRNTNLRSTTSAVNVFVQFKPENVQLLTNVTANKTCPGSHWNFTCSVVAAKPAVISYQLLENDVVVGTGSSGMWIRLLSSTGVFTYKCLANNTVGTTISENEKNINVTDPASVLGIVNSSNKAIEGDPFVVTCKPSGDPKLIIYWIKEDNNQRINGSILNFTSINRNDSGTYRCEVENDCASDSRVEVINVSFPSNINHTSDNQTVNQNDEVHLNCTADGFPLPTTFWTRLSDNSNVSMPFNISGRKDQGGYRCTAYNGIGDPDTAIVFITVQNFSPEYANLTSSLTADNVAVVNTTFNITCRTEANPPAEFRFYRDGMNLLNTTTGNNIAVFPTFVSERKSSVIYSCIPVNEYGDGPTATITVTVHYAPMIVKPTSSKWSVILSNIITVECLAEGSPDPSYVWTDDSDGSKTSGANLTIENVNDLDGRNYTYTCTAANDLGYDKRTVWIEIKRNRLRVQFIITKVDGKEAVYDNSKKDEIEKGVEKQINNAFRNEDNYNGIKEIYLRSGKSGSIIISCVICFKTPVTLNAGLAPLTAAAARGTLGPFTVENLRAIEDVSPTGSTAAPVKLTTSTPKVDPPPWGIIGGAIGAVVVVVIIIILVACWVHKKRKCIKDTKIHNSESEVLQGQNDIEDGVHAKVNGGYADAGPPSANGTNRFVQPQPEQQHQQAAAAPPDYAVVDKSKKKNKDSNKGNENIPDYAVVDKSKKKKNKKAEAEVEDRKKDTDKKTADPSTHDYAVVNKSKKKKKEEDENAYATVDKSKKSKKKPKAPGEVLYADLDDFKPVQAPSMPTVSTSPEPLAPLKRPPSYQATEYADITQFLKGNATLPEGQSTEMEPTYANAGGGQEAANKENANTGGEGGGGDTEHKETPM